MKTIAIISLVLVLSPSAILAQSSEVSRLADKLMKPDPDLQLRVRKAKDEAIEAAKSYKASLAKLLELQEADVKSASEMVEKRKKQLAENMVSTRELAESERMLATTRDKVASTKKMITESDSLIEDAMKDPPPMTRAEALKRAKEILASKRERRRDGRYQITYIFFGVAVVYVLR